MDLVSRDPGSGPDIAVEQIMLGRSNGMYPAYIVCNSENCGQVAFYGFFFSTPGIGECIYLENNRTCVVESIFYKISNLQFEGITIKAMIPNVFATLIEEHDKPDELDS